MNDLQNFSAYVPYMISHGNHESGFNFAHVTEFFRSQPSNTGTIATGASPSSPNNWWFSWNYGLVHFVTISTEVFSDHPTLVPRMLAWLETDLEAANANRTLAPWIIVHGHRPCYCSCDGDCDGGATEVRLGLEPLLYKYGVEFFIVGHEHNYERSRLTTSRTRGLIATTALAMRGAPLPMPPPLPPPLPPPMPPPTPPPLPPPLPCVAPTSDPRRPSWLRSVRRGAQGEPQRSVALGRDDAEHHRHARHHVHRRWLSGQPRGPRAIHAGATRARRSPAE